VISRCVRGGRIQARSCRNRIEEQIVTWLRRCFFVCSSVPNSGRTRPAQLHVLDAGGVHAARPRNSSRDAAHPAWNRNDTSFSAATQELPATASRAESDTSHRPGWMRASSRRWPRRRSGRAGTAGPEDRRLRPEAGCPRRPECSATAASEESAFRTSKRNVGSVKGARSTPPGAHRTMGGPDRRPARRIATDSPILTGAPK